MRVKHRIGAAMAAFLIGLGVAGGASAHMGMGGRSARMCGGDGEARLAGMIAYAEKKLDIAANQKPAWTVFTQAMRDAGKPMEQMCAEMTGEPPKEVDAALARRERMMAAALESLKSIHPAVAKLAETLTPEQRAKLNDLIPGQGMGGHHRWGHR